MAEPHDDSATPSPADVAAATAVEGASSAAG